MGRDQPETQYQPDPVNAGLGSHSPDPRPGRGTHFPSIFHHVLPLWLSTTADSHPFLFTFSVDARQDNPSSLPARSSLASSSSSSANLPTSHPFTRISSLILSSAAIFILLFAESPYLNPISNLLIGDKILSIYDDFSSSIFQILSVYGDFSISLPYFYRSEQEETGSLETSGKTAGWSFKFNRVVGDERLPPKRRGEIGKGKNGNREKSEKGKNRKREKSEKGIK
ncbi:hypothetical protein ACLOJK_016019 [Asimina triloba]